MKSSAAAMNGCIPTSPPSPIEPGDCFLICSDGLIDGLWERHLSDALANCCQDPAATAVTLLKRAIDNSGIDDTSLIVIAVSALPGESDHD